MTTSDALRAAIEVAVQRTVRGSALVTVRSVLLVDRAGIEGDIDGVLYGVIDFASDRCRLDSDKQRVLDGRGTLVLAGAASYQQLDDGRWTYMQGPLGPRGLMHPRTFLEALRLAFRTATAGAENQLVVELDRDTLNGIVDAGVADGVSVRALVACDDHGRIARVSLDLTDGEDSTPYLHLILDLEQSDGAVSIELPPAELTISARARIDEPGQ